LAEIAHRLGRKALEEVASTAQPDTILGWYRKLIANKFDGSRSAGLELLSPVTMRLLPCCKMQVGRKSQEVT
jgi:hypothetical protein